MTYIKIHNTRIQKIIGVESNTSTGETDAKNINPKDFEELKSGDVVIHLDID